MNSSCVQWEKAEWKEQELVGHSATMIDWMKSNDVEYKQIKKLDAGMWRYHANRMDARRSQFDLGRVVAYI